MVSPDDISNGFNFLATTQDTAEWVVNNLAAILLGAGTTYVGTKLRQHNERKKAEKLIESGKMNSDEVLTSITLLKKTDRIHPQNKEPIYDQSIISSTSFHMEQFIPTGWEAAASEKINKAKEMCTDNAPCIQIHLARISPDLSKSLNKEIVNSVSNDLNPMQNILLAQELTNQGEDVPENNYIPFLIREPGAQKDQTRLFLISHEELQANSLPQHDNIRMRTTNDDGDVVYRHDPNHIQALRPKTLQNLFRIYHESPENKAVFNNARITHYDTDKALRNMQAKQIQNASPNNNPGEYIPEG